jgi:transcriptional activator SPT8
MLTNVIRASQDNVRLWNTTEYFELDDSIKRSKSRPPFKIIAGHHGGIISSMREFTRMHPSRAEISLRE